MPRKLVIVLGPTASGKTDYSLELATNYGSPIISCDSRQIYKEMCIGTAVPSASQLAAVKHYFIQTRSVTEYYTAGIYEAEALELIERLFAEGHETLVMTGGSMFYIDAICNSLDNIPTSDPAIRAALQEKLENEGIESLREELRLRDPEGYESMELSNTQRVFRAVEICITTGKPYSSFKRDPGATNRSFEIEKIGISRPKEVLYERINDRVLKMMEMGLVDEVKSLTQFRDLTALQTVGYKEIFDYLDGSIDLDEAVRLIQRNTRHYAKRQMTWWRRDPSIKWIEF